MHDTGTTRRTSTIDETHMALEPQAIFERLEDQNDAWATGVQVDVLDPWIDVAVEHLPAVARYLRETPELSFKMLHCITAVDYLESIGMERIVQREAELLRYATERLDATEGVRIYGRAERKASVISFGIEGVHPHDIGTIVDDEGVAIRAGHHCAQPVMDHFGIPATARASLSYYNTTREIDQLAEAIDTVKDIFGK